MSVGLLVADPGRHGVEREHLGQHHGESQPVGQPPAAADRVPEGVDETDTGPAGLAEPGQMGRDEQLGARLEVRAVGHRAGQPARDRPDHLEGEPFGERVRVARQERLDRMGHRVDPGRGGRRGWQPDGQRRIEDGPDGTNGRVADVHLPSRDLVGHDPVRVRLGARAGGRRDGDERPTRPQVCPVVAEVEDVAAVRGVERDDLGRVHRRAATDGDDHRVTKAEPVERRTAQLDRRRAGVRLDPGEQPDLDAGGLQDRPDPIDDARSSNAFVGDDERPGRTAGAGRGSAAAVIPGSSSRAPTPKRTSSRRWSSIDRSASDPIS